MCAAQSRASLGPNRVKTQISPERSHVSFRQLRTYCFADLGPQCARDLSRCSNVSRQSCGYSITSSASNWIEFGTSMPSALAVLRLMRNSNLVICNTGRSAGFAPLRMLPV